MRNADIDYRLHLEICAVNDELVARLVLLRGDHQLKQTIQTWKGTDPLDVSLAINAVLVGPTGDAIVLEEQEPTRTVVTAWAFDGNKWRSVFSTSNPHIWVGRHHAAREQRTKVVTCTHRDATTCSEKTDRHEAWSWNGSKIEMEPCVVTEQLFRIRHDSPHRGEPSHVDAKKTREPSPSGLSRGADGTRRRGQNARALAPSVI